MDIYRNLPTIKFCGMLLKRGTGSEERGAGNGERKSGNELSADTSTKIQNGVPKFCADLFPAHRCPSVIKFQITLECAGVNRSNVLLISKAYFPANKMN